jgi:hypothetical protein
MENATGAKPLALCGGSLCSEFRDHTASKWYWIDQMEVVTNPVRQGNYALRVFGCESDYPANVVCPQGTFDGNKGNERREIHVQKISGRPGVMEYNKDRWLAISILIPTNGQFKSTDTYADVTSWVTHLQIGGERLATGSYAPFLNLIPTSGGKWRVDVSSQGGIAFGDTQKGVWHDFVIKFRPHYTAGSGDVVVKWRKAGGTFTTFKQSTAANLPSTWNRDTNLSFHAEHGVYRNGNQDGTQVVYFDGPWIGETESDVLGFFDDEPTQTPLATPTVEITFE